MAQLLAYHPVTTVWADPLHDWYRVHGRHHLPWRHTRDPWAVLVSEVMLQQTPVARVLPRWGAFLERWPDPAACATAPLPEILRFWTGLGYPRRARALWQTAAIVAAAGWPAGEAGLQRLPGVGVYTARALLVLAFGAADVPPRDVNAGRVTARAALGVEAHQATPAQLDAALRASRPPGVSSRDQTLALFDLGATVCTARTPACGVCPVRARCASAERLRTAPALPPAHRQPAYAGSQRQLRGAVLRALLDAAPPCTLAELRWRVASVAAAALDPGAVEAALAGLAADALLPPGPGVAT